MIEAYSTNVPVTTGTVVPLTTVNVVTPTTTLGTPNTAIDINTPGVYKIAVNANVTANSGSLTSASVQLLLNGSLVPYAFATNTVDNASANAMTNLAFTTLVKVVASTSSNVVKVGVEYFGSTGTINLLNVVITKEV